MKTTGTPILPATAANQTRLAAIDIGTNSIRCIVVEADPQGDFRVLDDEKASVRLGAGMNKSGKISSKASQRAIDTLQRMQKISTGLGAEVIDVVATSAVRKAHNREAFLHQVKEQTGLRIQVIDGTQEAELAALSVRHNFALENQRHAIADIGGGSVEIIIATGRHSETVLSLELGAVFLTEKFLRSDPLSDLEFRKLRKHIRKNLKAHGIGEGLPVASLIGSGGTMTNIGSMVMAMRGEQYESVHRYEILHSEVIHLLAMLSRSTHKERLNVPGLNPERADIILAGMLLTDELLRRCRTNLLQINAQGIREGLILQGLQKRGLLPSSPQPRDWRGAVIDFGRSCHFDERHALQVARLAGDIFAAVKEKAKLSQRSADLLEAAALLHDIGYFISYDRHHKHSYHLIRHGNILGFDPHERELLANITRYHRKGKPKKRHDNFARLAEEDQNLVRKLGGILRLADGLDRRRNSMTRQIDCQLQQNGTMKLRLIGSGDLSVERYGARSKGDLFEAAFGILLDIDTEEQ